MQQSAIEYLHTILNIFIFTSAVSFILAYAGILDRGNADRIEEMQRRSSIYMEHVSEEENDVPPVLTVSAAEVFTDILGDRAKEDELAEDFDNMVMTIYEIDGEEEVILDPEVIVAARRDDQNAILKIRNAVYVNSRYIPVMEYDKKNNLTKIIYRADI